MPAIDLTVLGSAGSHCGANRACSGYLLESRDTKVLVDAGNGSTANLLTTTSFDDLDAIFVSHRHVDHCIDLIGMYYALRFHEDGPKSVDLYAAPEVLEQLTKMLSEDSPFAFTDVFRHTEVNPGDRAEAGEFEVEFFAAEHTVPTVAMRFTSGDTTLAYSADNAGGDDLIRCAGDSDLFVCEATWQGDASAYPPGIHLTATEAAAHAVRADVGQLVLTHVLGSLDPDRALEESIKVFRGPTQAARDLLRLSVG